jgi:hypothetical protein
MQQCQDIAMRQCQDIAMQMTSTDGGTYRGCAACALACATWRKYQLPQFRRTQCGLVAGGNQTGRSGAGSFIWRPAGCWLAGSSFSLAAGWLLPAAAVPVP